MPSDITGTSMIERLENGKQQFTFQKGPIFSQMVLADEINRATPKTQSALAGSDGEKTVTVLGETKQMDDHSLFLLRKIQLKWKGPIHYQKHKWTVFYAKLLVSYPSKAELKEITKRTTGGQQFN